MSKLMLYDQLITYKTKVNTMRDSEAGSKTAQQQLLDRVKELEAELADERSRHSNTSVNSDAVHTRLLSETRRVELVELELKNARTKLGELSASHERQELKIESLLEQLRTAEKDVARYQHDANISKVEAANVQQRLQDELKHSATNSEKVTNLVAKLRESETLKAAAEQQAPAARLEVTRLLVKMQEDAAHATEIEDQLQAKIRRLSSQLELLQASPAASQATTQSIFGSDAAKPSFSQSMHGSEGGKASFSSIGWIDQPRSSPRRVDTSHNNPHTSRTHCPSDAELARSRRRAASPISFHRTGGGAVADSSFHIASASVHIAPASLQRVDLNAPWSE